MEPRKEKKLKLVNYKKPRKVKEIMPLKLVNPL